MVSTNSHRFIKIDLLTRNVSTKTLTVRRTSKTSDDLNFTMAEGSV